METITAEQAEIDAARNWCAGLLSGAASRIKGDVAKRYVDIGVGTLLSNYKDDEMIDEEKLRRCNDVYKESCDAHPDQAIIVCEVDGEKYALCTNCPLRVENP